MYDALRESGEPGAVTIDVLWCDRLRVSRGEKMTLRGTDPESYVTVYTSAYEDYGYHCRGNTYDSQGQILALA